MLLASIFFPNVVSLIVFGFLEIWTNWKHLCHQNACILHMPANQPAMCFAQRPTTLPPHFMFAILNGLIPSLICWICQFLLSYSFSVSLLSMSVSVVFFLFLCVCKWINSFHFIWVDTCIHPFSIASSPAFRVAWMLSPIPAAAQWKQG